LQSITDIETGEDDEFDPYLTSGPKEGKKDIWNAKNNSSKARKIRKVS
jgi:hypothetical protein